MISLVKSCKFIVRTGGEKLSGYWGFAEPGGDAGDYAAKYAKATADLRAHPSLGRVHHTDVWDGERIMEYKSGDVPAAPDPGTSHLESSDIPGGLIARRTITRKAARKMIRSGKKMHWIYEV